MAEIKKCLTLTFCILLGACKPLTDPELNLPQQLSQGNFQISKYTQTIEFDTVVPRARGTFQLGPWSGTFDRSSHGFAITSPQNDPREFSASFSVSGPTLEVPVTINCAFALGGSENGIATVSSSLSSFTTRAAYRCGYASADYEDGGGLVLAQPNSAGRNRNHNHLRVGRSVLNDTALEIESIHTSPDIPIRVDDPLGFVFRAGQGSVASVNLRQRKFRLRQDVSIEMQRNAVFAALALIMRNKPQD